MASTDAMVRTWISLLDSAEVLRRSVSARDPRSCDQVSQAVDLLLKHEHTMTAQQREQARFTVWQRDHGDEPLPEICERWWQCTCRLCKLERIREGVRAS